MKTDLGYPLIDEVLSKRGKGVDDAQMVIKIMEYMGEKVDYKINGKSIVGRFSTQKARDLIKQAIRQERSEKLAGSITDAMGDPASEDEREKPKRSASAGLSL
jgi:predicted DsbA family dithiol-disulfide isomerase